MISDALEAITIVAFDPSRHIREGFNCGVQRVDNFLHRTARKHQKGDFARVWVACEIGAPQIIGYYTLNAHSFSVRDLTPSKSLTRHAPQNGHIPALYLSMIGVDRRFGGKGIGTVLMADAMKRAAVASSEVGIKLLVLDSLNDDDQAEKRRKFYARLGFIGLPSHPTRMYITTATLRAALGGRA